MGQQRVFIHCTVTRLNLRRRILILEFWQNASDVECLHGGGCQVSCIERCCRIFYLVETSLCTRYHTDVPTRGAESFYGKFITSRCHLHSFALPLNQPRWLNIEVCKLECMFFPDSTPQRRDRRSADSTLRTATSICKVQVVHQCFSDQNSLPMSSGTTQ